MTDKHNEELVAPRVAARICCAVGVVEDIDEDVDEACRGRTQS